jgi:hypothetical protein
MSLPVTEKVRKGGNYFMWRLSVYALLLGSILLVGCNNNEDAVNDRPLEDAARDIEDAVEDTGRGIEEGLEDAGRGVNEAVDDVQEGVNEALDNDAHDFGDGIENSNGAGINENAPELRNGDERIHNNRTNTEDIIEDPKDVRDADRIDE